MFVSKLVVSLCVSEVPYATVLSPLKKIKSLKKNKVPQKKKFTFLFISKLVVSLCAGEVPCATGLSPSKKKKSLKKSLHFCSSVNLSFLCAQESSRALQVWVPQKNKIKSLKKKFTFLFISKLVVSLCAGEVPCATGLSPSKKKVYVFVHQ